MLIGGYVSCLPLFFNSTIFLNEQFGMVALTNPILIFISAEQFVLGNKHVFLCSNVGHFIMNMVKCGR